jgi:hypothetical protein
MESLSWKLSSIWQKRELLKIPPAFVSGELEELSGMVAAIDDNLTKNCRLLNDKIKALEGMLAASPHPSPHDLPGLAMSTAILDNNGDCVTTLGGILQENSVLKCNYECLKGALEKLAADITAQGSVVMGRFTFTSELKLTKLCIKEYQRGMCLLRSWIQ